MDGTLVDTAEDLAGAMNFALAKFGLPTHSVQACKRMIGDGLAMFAQRALPQDMLYLRDRLLVAMKMRYHDKCFEHSRLYDGIFEVVSKLRQRGIHLAVLTNKDHQDAERIVEHFFGADTFKSVVGVVDSRKVKPDTEGIMSIVESMELSCEDFLLVGDSAVDIQTAKAAGIRSVGAGWGFRKREELVQAGADIVIDRPTEILGLIA